MYIMGYRSYPSTYLLGEIGFTVHINGDVLAKPSKDDKKEVLVFKSFVGCCGMCFLHVFF